MRLKHIKLAGFKSFVDPTKVPFEHQMTAIVGPNGCGKSNIIDAVRWVLGESSAKNLRGDAMTDVIFNGAATRKPVGQASVELVFDNTSGRIQGSMADRSEVSIRRVVNRDSVNSYFLNGTKCRRRDITDIFLGTGLGPRSYAIIEQGTISRLIESKPQELRIFIEEAAGISKYKERRRETEHRISHTRENLSRLADIRSELNLRIDTLHKQAEGAKRYRTLKAKERQLRAELVVLRLKQYQEKQQNFELQFQKTQDQMNDLNAAQTNRDNSLHQAKALLSQGNESTQTLQQQKLNLTNDIARTEQKIKHVKLQQNVLTQEQQLTEKKIATAQSQLDDASIVFANKTNEIEQLAPKVAEAEQTLSQLYQSLSVKTQAHKHWQQQWQTHQELQQSKREQLNKIEHRIEQLTDQIASVNQQQQTVNDEINDFEQSLSQINTDALRAEHDKVSQQLIAKETELTAKQSIVAKDNKALSQCQKDIALYQAEIASLSGLITQLNDELARNASWQDSQKNWLVETLDYEHVLAPIFSQLTVEPQWEQAVELVLAELIVAHQLKSTADIRKIDPQTLPETIRLFVAEHHLAPVGLENCSVSEQHEQALEDTLAAKVSGLPALNHLLNHVLIVDNFLQGQATLKQCGAHQTVISQDGIWQGRHFIKRGAIGAQQGIIQKQNQLKVATERCAVLQQQLQQGEQQFARLNAQLAAHEDNLQQLKADSTQLQNTLINLSQNQALSEQKQTLLKQQLAQCLKKRQQNILILENHQQALSQQKLTLIDIQQNADEQQAAEISAEQGQVLQQGIDHCHQDIQQANEQKQQLVVQLERAKHQHQNAREQQKALQLSLESMTIALEEQKLKLSESAIPLANDEQQLQQWLAQMVEVEQQLSQINDQLAGAQQALANFEQSKDADQKALNKLKDLANKQQLDAESYKLRAQGCFEQLREMQVNLTDIEKELPKTANEGVWQAQLAKLAKDINQLGAINLAAIKEYEEQLARKDYLDQQNFDLTEALSTLEQAIVKIDKQSRQQFKETFDQVNKDLKALFPKVFGGGSAYLDLTGDDLLETGVSIMARPPGKKNSTIHLLSGGEKALTALSLVFAIFRLNPAPFCMLDEVDAPLDDANVERFCNLVQEMSQSVQFIYISHNKIAMEMASQLTGVTMFEPGVSRMVAVDIDEAMAMAELD